MRTILGLVLLTGLGCQEKMKPVPETPPTAEAPKVPPATAQTPLPSLAVAAAPANAGGSAPPAAPTGTPSTAAGTGPKLGAPIAAKNSEAPPVKVVCTQIEQAGPEWTIRCDRTNTDREAISGVDIEFCFYKAGKKIGVMHGRQSFPQPLTPGASSTGEWSTLAFQGEDRQLAGAVIRPMLVFVSSSSRKWASGNDCPDTAP
jgi:hypothetical protein